MKYTVFRLSLLLTIFFMMFPVSAFANYPTDNPNPNCLQQSYWDTNTAYCQNLGYPNPSGTTPPPTNTNPPYSPFNLAVSSTGVLTWSENDSTVTSYNIYVNGVLAGSSTTTSYTFTTLNPSDVIKVKAVNTNGENVVDSGNTLTYSGAAIGGSTPTGGGTLTPPTNVQAVQRANVAYPAYDVTWDAVQGANYGIYWDGVFQSYVTTPSYYASFTDSGPHTLGITTSINGQQSTQTSVTLNGTSTTPTGGSGSGSNTSCNGCTMIQQMLACPSWSQYMGDFTNAVKAAIPPPPDWQNVASIMSNTIVPAMGAELIKDAPQLAKILADELQSREKPVNPPPPLPAFTPSVPTMTDIPTKVTDSITANVPDFTPDFTKSSPFSIPDPTQLDYSTQDKGYAPTGTLNTTVPAYNNTAPTITDKGYMSIATPTISAPSYTNTNAATSAPIPTYTSTNVQANAPMPTYTNTNAATSAPMPNYTNTNSTNGTPIPQYQPH